MAKLYPPHLEGTIPAFTKGTLIVPFSMNRAVGPSEVNNVVIKIKKVNSNEVILTKYANSFNAYNNCRATFNLTAKEQELFNIGQYYRIQMAYIDATNTIGYFSSVGVIKYTAMPKVEIVGLKTITTNLHSYDYVGQYIQIDDPTEKLYSSRLQLIDSKNNIIEDSGEIIHTSLNDIIPNQALEHFSFSQDLSSDEIYKLVLTMTSVNGLQVVSPKYKIIQRENNIGLQFDEVKNIVLKAEANYEAGCGTITLRSKIEDKEVMSGTFTLFRSHAEPPYRWEKIQNFIIKAGKINDVKFKD